MAHHVSPQVLEMLAQQAADADLPPDRRVADMHLVSLIRFLVNSRVKNAGGKPRSDPRKPRNGRPKPPDEAHDNVVPIRPVD